MFLKVSRAYEVLKDEDLRKKYDKYGEKGLDQQQQGGRYESWNYYRFDFGKFPVTMVLHLEYIFLSPSVSLSIIIGKHSRFFFEKHLALKKLSFLKLIFNSVFMTRYL